MKIFLTGAGGFVGGHLLSRLKQDNHFVRALSRRAAPGLAPADDVLIETLSPASDFDGCLTDIDVVIHLADGFNAFEHLPYSAQNEDAEKRLHTTVLLAQAAARNHVRFIYLSTIKTQCGAYADEILSEKTIPHPKSLYGRLKLEAEQAIMAAARQQGAKAVILRFPVVFGPGVGGNMERLRSFVDGPMPLPFKGIENRRSLISSASLIDAVMRIIEQEEAGEGVFLVHDEAVSSAELIGLLRKGLGRPKRLFALPSIIWPGLEILPGPGPKLRRFTRSLELDDQKFRQTFNWQPEKRLEARLLDYGAEGGSKD